MTRPPGWRSRRAEHAERCGKMAAEELALETNMPLAFIKQHLPRKEWHHIESEGRVRKVYYWSIEFVRSWLKTPKARNLIRKYVKRMLQPKTKI